MKRLTKELLCDETGVIVTVELILIATIGTLGLVAGWNAVANSLTFELADVANATSALDQSYSYRAVSAPNHASCSGGGYADARQSFSVQTNDVQIVAGDDGTVTIPVVQLQEPVTPIQATPTAEEALLFQIERIEELNPQGEVINSLSGLHAESETQALSSDDSAELQSLLTEIEVLCRKAEQLKAQAENK